LICLLGCLGVIVVVALQRHYQHTEEEEILVERSGAKPHVKKRTLFSFFIGDQSSDKMLSEEHSPLTKHQDGRRRQVHDKPMTFDDIVIKERIGKGSYGEVFRGMWRGTEVAVKKLPYYMSELDDEEQRKEFSTNFIHETELMKSLRHPNIIQLYATFTIPEVCMVMEYMSRGSLYHILHDKTIELSWDIIRRIMIDAAKGMTYLHNSQPVIVHRDLKSHNLLVGEYWNTKVSDFGLSRILDVTHTFGTMTSCGTPSWTAPEVLRGEKYTEKCDVYSFGIVLWECVTRQTPYDGIPPFQIVFQVSTQGMRPTIPQDCPHSWSTLIVECWDESPENRPSFEDILHSLESF